MSTIINGIKQNQVEDLNNLSSELYENIFKLLSSNSNSDKSTSNENTLYLK